MNLYPIDLLLERAVALTSPPVSIDGITLSDEGKKNYIQLVIKQKLDNVLRNDESYHCKYCRKLLDWRVDASLPRKWQDTKLHYHVGLCKEKHYSRHFYEILRREECSCCGENT